ncbi:MAG: cyclic nucleotide-binding domain-containing protein [Magnetococcales bacterium]|nr:cyclic nucleotide-binding domain-containing protein [Magnetococcales bacterium]
MDQDKINAVLKDIFLDSDELIHEYNAGDEIIYEGKENITLYYVARGSVQVTKHSDGSRIEVATISEGGVFGEHSYFGHGLTTASIIATQPTTLRCLYELELEKRLTRNPELAITFLKYITKTMAERSSVQVLDSRPDQIAQTIEKATHALNSMKDHYGTSGAGKGSAFSNGSQEDHLVRDIDAVIRLLETGRSSQE